VDGRRLCGDLPPASAGDPALSEPAVASRSSPILLVIAIAAAVRLGYAALGFPDYWGDAYHNWLISRLTLEHHWVYSDYKGREVVWEPLFRYLSTLAMYLTGRADMLPGRLVSWVAGSLGCGATAALAARLTGSPRWGQLAGLIQAVTPWHVAYSWMYMPETTASLIFTLILLLIVSERLPWGLPGLAGLGVLARHDVTVLLVLTTGWLLATRRFRPAWLILGGVAAGMGGWCLWTWHVTGDPLWWLIERTSTSASDAAFWVKAGARPSPSVFTLPLTVLQVFAPVLVIAAAAGYGLRDGEWRRSVVAGPRGLIVFLVLAFLPIIGVMQIRFFPYPDPRYLLETVSLMSVLAAVTIRFLPDAKARRASVWAAAVVAVLSLVVQVPGFAFRPYTIARERAAGEQLATVAPAAGMLWVDAPVAIYHSGIAPDRFVSDEQMVPMARTNLPAALDAAFAAIAQRDIRLIYWDNVPYSLVPQIWPQMADGRPFEMRGVRFDPVYRYDSWVRAAGDPSLAHLVRERIEHNYGPVTLWSVTRATS